MVFKIWKLSHLYDGLFHAAHYRNRADWLLDINTTRALTIAADDGLYSLEGCRLTFSFTLQTL